MAHASSTILGRPRRRRAFGLGLLALAALLAAWAVVAAVERIGVAPRLLGPYLERRASGHAPWIEAFGRSAHSLLLRLDRGDVLPHPHLPSWAGARVAGSPAPAGRFVGVATPQELQAVLASARPGDVITLAPGTYRFAGHALEASAPATAAAPISVRADVFGTVTLEFQLLEGFRVTAPYWRFENLRIRGTCTTHDACEHALHVVGGAHHVVIRNNELIDFNAHIKINGAGGRFPDHGRIEGNTLVNTAPRATRAPVTPIDLVAASNWHIEGNLIADFVRAGAATTYGAFAKGGGVANRFLRNVVLCEWRLRGAPGSRVGLSFGGGGSDAPGCRDGRCVVEHEDGLMAGNLIASCSDEGVYIKRAARTRVLHNTVLDTAGVYVRYPESTALVAGNLVDGPIRAREGAILDAQDNVATALPWLYLGRHPVRDLFVDAETLDLRFRSPPARVDAGVDAADLCAPQRLRPATVGAFEDFAVCRARR
ncbi:MAG TPA: right-handed parallel beta-helix repeat-containing protein [Burkholderiaceae bacterium]|nr:right-handed parallel beta-helix repeat-containing protein [Burkholderiaceae bacterium]